MAAFNDLAGFINLHTNSCSSSPSSYTFSDKADDDDGDFAFFPCDEDQRSLPPASPNLSSWWTPTSFVHKASPERLSRSRSSSIFEATDCRVFDRPPPSLYAEKYEGAINANSSASVNMIKPPKPNRMLRRRRCLPLHIFSTRSRSLNASKSDGRSSTTADDLSQKISESINAQDIVIGRPPAVSFRKCKPSMNLAPVHNSCAIFRDRVMYKSRSLNAAKMGAIIAVNCPQEAKSQNAPGHINGRPHESSAASRDQELKARSLSASESGRSASFALREAESVNAQFNSAKRPGPSTIKAHAEIPLSGRRPCVKSIGCPPSAYSIPAPIFEYGRRQPQLPTNLCSRPSTPLHCKINPHRNSVLALHYMQQRLDSHELTRKTFLPYRTNLLGC